MIIGTKDVAAEDVRKHCGNVETLRQYCELLVPRILRHDKRILANQKYYVALIVRDIKSIPFDRRRELYEGLLEGVAVTGLANEIYDWEDILAQIDINKLADFINKGGGKDAGHR